MAWEAPICISAAALAAVIILFLLSRRAVKVAKKIQGQTVCITITARKNLDLVALSAQVEGEELRFERRRVRKGQSVEFVFPSGNGKCRLSVKPESGRIEESEI